MFLNDSPLKYSCMADVIAWGLCFICSKPILNVKSLWQSLQLKTWEIPRFVFTYTIFYYVSGTTIDTGVEVFDWLYGSGCVDF